VATRRLEGQSPGTWVDREEVSLRCTRIAGAKVAPAFFVLRNREVEGHAALWKPPTLNPESGSKRRMQFQEGPASESGKRLE